jgi:nucleolar complex protein 2
LSDEADKSDSEDNDPEDDESLEDISEDEDEGMTHALELSKLKEKDPEFYKYLEENDKELLDFDPAHAMEGVILSDEDMDGQDSDGKVVPPLTAQLLKSWQKALLEVGFRFHGVE